MKEHLKDCKTSFGGTSFYSVEGQPVCGKCIGAGDDDGDEDDEEDEDEWKPGKMNVTKRELLLESPRLGLYMDKIKLFVT